jgi:HEAT repeat protein
MPDKKENKIKIPGLIKMLNSKNLDDRVVAIHILGEEGDRDALIILRERLSSVSKEMNELVIAVGKLKRKSG